MIHGCATVPIGDLCRIVGGGTPSRKNEAFYQGDIPWVTVKDFDGLFLKDAQEHITQDAVGSSATNIIPADSVLVVTRVGLGKVALTTRPLAINQDVKALIPDDRVIPEYLLWFMTSYAPEIARIGVGATVKGITLKDLKSIQVPVPAIPEQRRIVDILKRTDGIRRLRKQAIQTARELIPALFVDMFGDPATNSKGWPVLNIGSFTILVTSGATPRGGAEIYVKSGPYFIRSQNVLMSKLDFSDVACLPQEVHEQMARTKVQLGDVLLNITGASIGRVAWVNQLDREANVNQHVCIIRVDRNLVEPSFLSVFLSMPFSQRVIMGVQAGASRQALNHQQVRQIKVFLPPISIQKEFAMRIDQTHSINFQHEKADAMGGAMFSAVLHRAFRGEL